MKRLIFLLLLTSYIFSQFDYVPSRNRTRTLLPRTDSVYNIGSATKAYNMLYVNSFGFPILALGDITIEDATPVLQYKDTDASAGDVNFSIQADALDAGDGTEDIDVLFSAQVAGTPIGFMSFDADGDFFLRSGGGADNQFVLGASGEASFGDRVTADRLRVIHTTSTDVSALPIYVSETLSGNFGLASTPAYGMTVYSKILGANLTATDAYESAVTGLYGITGTNDSVYPKAAVLGWIADNTKTADAAFIALIDGDTQVTQAGAAFGVRHLNSTATSGFNFGLDLYGAAIRGYSAVSYRTADIRGVNQETIDNTTDGTWNFGTSRIMTTKTTEQMRLNYDATNYLKVEILADAHTTFTTVDPDGAEADIKLSPDGIIELNAKVGIGIESPTSKLHVYSDNNPNGVFMVDIDNHDGSGTDARGLKVRGGALNSVIPIFVVADYNDVPKFSVMGEGDVILAENLALVTTKELLFDGGGGHTKIAETSSDVLSTSVGGVEATRSTEVGGDIINTSFGTIELRGSAITMYHMADATLQYGMIAMVDDGTDMRFDINDVNGDEPIGVVTGVGATSQGSYYGLALVGMAHIVPEEGTNVARGDIVHSSSTTAGYGEFDATLTMIEVDEQVGHTARAEDVTATISGTGGVNIGTEVITLGVNVTALGWVVGDPVVYWNSGGATLGGLTDGWVYWLLSVNTVEVTISATKGGALVDLTDDGDEDSQYLQRLPLVHIQLN